MTRPFWQLDLLNPEGSRDCIACKKKFTYGEIMPGDAVAEGKPVRYSNDSLWAESACSSACLAASLEAAKRKKDRADEQYRLTHINELMVKAGVPKEHLKFLLSNFDQTKTPSQKKLHTFVFKCGYPFSKPILVIGPAGAGKTHLAVALLREVILKGYCVDPLFITGVDLMAQLRLANSPDREISPDDIISRFTRNRFVVFDDIGVERITDYVLQSWYQIIDTRYSQGLPTMYTSNLTQAQCEEKFGSRITSRLFGGKVFEIEGADVRIAMGERESV